MARYRKIEVRIWNDRKFRSLDDKTKLVFFMLLTHPDTNQLGFIRARSVTLAMDLGWDSNAMSNAIQMLCKMGMLMADEMAGLMFLPNFLKYNPPNGLNGAKSWEGLIDLLPECDLLNIGLIRLKPFIDGLSDGIKKGIPDDIKNAIANAIQYGMKDGCRIQEQEQEQEQELLSASSSTRENKSEKVSKPKKETKQIDFYGVSDSVRDDWISLRKKKRAVVSQNVVDELKAKADEIGWTLDRVMKMIVSRNWQGFETRWLEDLGIKVNSSQDQFRVKKPLHGSKTPEGVCTPWDAPEEASESVLRALGGN